MTKLASTVLLAALATAFLAGLADSVGQALGGGFSQGVVGWMVILAGLRSGWHRTPRGRGLVHLAYLAAAALLLPLGSPWLGSLLAGPLASWQTLGAFLLPLLLLHPGLSPFGSLVSRETGEPSPLWAWWAGGVLGLAVVLRFGLGPTRFLLLAALLAFLLPRGKQAPPASAEKKSPAGSFLIPFAGFLILFWLQPWLALFDPGGSPHDFRRVLTWGFLVLFGMVTLGSSPNRLMAGVYCAVLAASVGFAGRTAGLPPEMAESASLLGVFGVPPGGDMAGHSLYVPWGVLLVAGLPAIAFGAAWGSCVGLKAGANAVRPLFAAGGTALFLSHVFPDTALLAMAAAVAAGIFCILSTDWGMAKKAGLAIGIAILPILADSLPETPHGFARPRWVFHYKVLPKANGESSETTAQGTVIRLLERDSAANLGQRFLSQGDHLLTPDASGEVTWRYDTLFAASLQGQPAKVLLVGPPHAGSVQELRLSGSGEIHLACDPLELWRTSSHLPEWAGLAPDAVSACVAESEGGYDLILLRDVIPWRRHSNLLRPQLFATAKKKLGSRGVFAVLLDLETTGQGALGSVQRWMKDHFPHHGVWLVPRRLRTPGVLIAGGRFPLADKLAPVFKAGLADRGLSIGSAADLALLRVGSFDCQAGRLRAALSPPLARLPSLLLTWPAAGEGAIPLQRAARVLRAVRKDCSSSEGWLDFYIAHLESQVWDARDELFNPEDKQIEIGENSLKTLLALAEESPKSRLLQALGSEIASLLAPQREVEWIQTYLLPLAEKHGWRNPEILVALGSAALEMFEAEEALGWAAEALFLQPGNLKALDLKKKAEESLAEGP